MTWRDGKYYQRSKRVDGDVVTEYVGTGIQAQAAALLDERERMQRKAKQELERREQKRQDDLDRELSEVDDLIRALVGGVMLASGHRSHKRQWRKKRNG